MDTTTEKKCMKAHQQRDEDDDQLKPYLLKYQHEHMFNKKSSKDQKLSTKLDPEVLMNKSYIASEAYPKVFSFGQLGLMDGEKEVRFRVFHEDDLLIPSKYQRKLQNQVMDEDCETQASQIAFAHTQNRQDLMHALYVNERHIDPASTSVSQMERSLFFNTKHSYTQNPQFTTDHSQIIYFSQPTNEYQY